MRIRDITRTTTSLTGLGGIQLSFDGEAAAGGGDSVQAAGNGGVNADSTAGAVEGNGGQDFDVASFWAQQQDADPGTGTQQTDDVGKELGTQLVSQIGAFKAEDV